MKPVASPTIKRKDLAIFLERLDPVPNPKDTLEQYPVPAEIAAEVLFRAYGHRDVWRRRVADLGCGNGILAIGAAHLNASRVVALDVDEEALAVAQRNAAKHGLEIAFTHGDVGDFLEQVDTVFMNPPFGGQSRHADRPFLAAALRAADVVYTFHNAATGRYVEREVSRLGGAVQERRTYKFPLPHLQPYHRSAMEEIEVHHYRILKGDA